MKKTRTSRRSSAKAQQAARRLSTGPASRRQGTQPHKVAAVMRLLCGEDIETVAREIAVTAAVLNEWREMFVAAGTVALEHDGFTPEKLEIEYLKAMLNEALSGSVTLPQQFSVTEDHTTVPLQDDGAQAFRSQIEARVQVLSRHYAADRNPLFAWKAIRLLTELQPCVRLPEWVKAYLGAAACKLVDMGEGIDWTTAPKPPAPGSNDAAVQEFCRRYSAWSQNLKLPQRLKSPQSGRLRATAGRVWPVGSSLEPKKSGALVLKALGFSTSNRKNYFLDYAKALVEQDLGRRYLVWREWQERMQARGVSRRRLGSPSHLAGANSKDPGNFSKQMRRAVQSLKRGRLEPEAGGPIQARLAQLWFGKQ